MTVSTNLGMGGIAISRGPMEHDKHPWRKGSKYVLKGKGKDKGGALSIVQDFEHVAVGQGTETPHAAVQSCL